VVGLIERFYDPLEGAVLLDGRDIRALNLGWLRAHVRVWMRVCAWCPSMYRWRVSCCWHALRFLTTWRPTVRMAVQCHWTQC
jgi:hypothetical protein